MGSIVFDQPLQLPLSPEKLSAINAHLSQLPPQEILQWAIDYIPGLHQTTAYGLTGLVAIDMLSKLSSPAPPVVFFDTLYHFKETYELVQEIQDKYHLNLNVYKPYGCQSTFDFEEMYGHKLWETNESMYDWAVKVCYVCLMSMYRADHFHKGGTCSASVPRDGYPRRHHWPTCLARRRACIPPTSRGRLYGSPQTQPSLRMVVLPSRIIH